MASFTAAGTALRQLRRADDSVLHLLLDVRLPAQSATLSGLSRDSRGKGFLVGGTAGRTTLLGEGLQHQDGHTPLLFSVVPTCKIYDPAYAYEIAIIVQDGIRRMYQEREDCFYYLTVYNENYAHPEMPED